MERIKKFFRSFTLLDGFIWGGSVLAIVLSFILCKNHDYLQLAASLVGACCLILTAKGNVLGQFLSVIFSVCYGVISYFCAYYGEMITYLGMTAPTALAAIITWMKHPFRGDRSEVTVSKPSVYDYAILILLSVVISIVFYFLLGALHTNNLLWSTLSVLTSALAVLLTVRRSPYYAFAYALNDIVLIVLWSLMAAEDSSYVAMIVCFSVFLLNDCYALINWLLRRKRQSEIRASESNEFLHLR